MDHEIVITSQINKDKNKPGVTINVSGELNATNTSTFEQEVKNIFLKEPQDIFLDLSKVTVFVSASIGSLLLMHDFVTRKNYKFQIVALNEKVKSILVVTGLDKIMVL